MSVTPHRDDTGSRVCWQELDSWLRSSEGGELLDTAVLGCLGPAWASELIADFGIPDHHLVVTQKRFFALVDRALGEGF